MHLAKSLAVDGRIGNNNSAANHWLLLVLLCPYILQFRTYECLNSLGVGLCSDNENLVVKMKDGVAHWIVDLAFMEEAGTYDVAV